MGTQCFPPRKNPCRHLGTHDRTAVRTAPHHAAPSDPRRSTARQAPFSAVDASSEACVEAAEALRRGVKREEVKDQGIIRWYKGCMS